MPIYEYECKKCGSKFELLRKIGEDDNACCPQCGGRGERVYSAVPMIFKGGRWVGEKTKTPDGDGGKKPGKKS
jgi:putative FmdB family regulatory protein